MFDVIDPDGLDQESMITLMQSASKTELTFQWLQQLIVDAMKDGLLTIGDSILTRAFQEMANGMVAFHHAMKISYIPFPFPYAQICDFLLLLHWVMTPFVITQWVFEPGWAGIFAFLQTFILWALNSIAKELECPFGKDANDIDTIHLQEEMNRHLNLLLAPSTLRTPCLQPLSIDLTDPRQVSEVTEFGRSKCFCDCWEKIQNGGASQVSVCRRSVRRPQTVGINSVALHSLRVQSIPSTETASRTLTATRSRMCHYTSPSPTPRMLSRSNSIATSSSANFRRPSTPSSTTSHRVIDSEMPSVPRENFVVQSINSGLSTLTVQSNHCRLWWDCSHAGHQCACWSQ